MSQNISVKTSLETFTITPEPTDETTLDTTPKGSTQESADRTTVETTAQPTARPTSGPVFVCPQEDIMSTGCEGPKDCLYPNPQNCHTLIECTVNSDGVSGTPRVMPCAAQLEWNDRKEECDYPELSTCADRSTPRPLTTYSPTDTTVTDETTQGTTATEEPTTTTPESTDKTTIDTTTERLTDGSAQGSTKEPADTTTQEFTDEPTTTEETSDGPTQGSTETPTDSTTGAEPTQTNDDANQDIKQQPKFYARDSLDRFGDDLFGYLLSYLSLEDRFRLESVSKQFRRTVFGSVVDICIDNHLIANPLKTQMLATIAMKCYNIQRLDCRLTSEELIPEVINAFGDHLRDIHCTLGPNSDQWLPNFGSLVREIDLRSSSANQSLIHCQRLSRLQIHTLSDVFDTTSGQLLVRNLKRFDVKLMADNDNQLLAAFVSGNPSLKSLSVHTSCDLRELSVQLSVLTQLRELTLDLVLMNDENLLSESLRKIGINCKQMQRLTVKVVFNDFTLNGQTLDALRYYPRLKRLHFAHFVTANDVLTRLRFCQRLTHLTLESRRINAELFQDCDKQCPRLQYVCIRTDTMTGECLSHISRLPTLKTLKLFLLNSLSDNDLCPQELLSRSTIVCNPVILAMNRLMNRAMNRIKNRAKNLAKK